MVREKNSFVFSIVNTVLLLCISLIMLYPFVYLLMISFSPIEELMKSEIFLYPKVLTLDSYQFVLNHPLIGNAYSVTIYVTVLGTLLNLLITSLGAYVLAQKRLPGKNFFITLIIVTMVFNGGIIPNYLVVKSLGFIDSLWALMIPNLINTFWMIIMRNFFSGIPESLAESARIDGWSEYRILFALILPLSGPILATLALFYGVAHWNEYFNAIIYINKEKLMPLQVLIRSMYDSGAATIPSENLPPPAETMRAATIMVATLPILCLYPFLQKYFVQGIMVGAVKG